MSSHHPSKVLVNRYWKRPKPKIYECNIRDAERFYKDSYNEYLQSKNFYASHGTTPTDIEEQFATKWTLNRVNSRLDSQFDPNARGNSVLRYNDNYGSTTEEIGNRNSRVRFSRHDSLTENNSDSRPSYRSSSLVQSHREPSTNSQLENIESRLERIKLLREELGLSTDGTTEDFNSNGVSARSILKKSSQQDIAGEKNGYKSELSQNVYSNIIKDNNRSNGNDTSVQRYENKYSVKSDRSARNARNEEVDNHLPSFNNKSERTSRSYMIDDTTPNSARSRIRDNKYESDDKYSSNYTSNGTKNKDEDYLQESKYTSSYRTKGNKYNDEDSTQESKYTSSYRTKGNKYNDEDSTQESKYTPKYRSKCNKYNDEVDAQESKYTSSYRSKGNKYIDEDCAQESKYTPSYRSKASKYTEDDFAVESKSPRTAAKNTTFATTKQDDYSNLDDDDDLVSNLKKKFPTSDEILERIKKIDNDL